MLLPALGKSSKTSLNTLIASGDICYAKKTLLKKNNLIASFGVEQIDSFVNISFGNIHEWSLQHELSSQNKYIWHPPMLIILALLSNSIADSYLRKRKYLIWIGKKCWPSFQVLEKIFIDYAKLESNWSWRDNCIFIDPPTKKETLWSAEKLLKDPSVFSVIVDGGKMDLIASRRLQHAARKGNSLGLILRPPWELQQLSCARTKWLAKTTTGVDIENKNNQLRWSLELLKGGQKKWNVQWNPEWNPEWNELLERDVLMQETEAGIINERKNPLDIIELQERPKLQRKITRAA